MKINTNVFTDIVPSPTSHLGVHSAHCNSQSESSSKGTLSCWLYEYNLRIKYLYTYIYVIFALLKANIDVSSRTRGSRAKIHNDQLGSSSSSSSTSKEPSVKQQGMLVYLAVYN